MPPVNPTLFYHLLGPYATRAQIVAYPGLSVNGGGAGYVSRYEVPLGNIKHGEEWLWNDFNTNPITENVAAGHGQYDSAYREYAWYAMTGNETYLTRGNAFAVAYRDFYIIPANYGPASENTNSRGLAMHYAATGDEASRRAVGGIANTAVGDNATYGWTRYSRIRPLPAAADQRIWTRAMEAAMYAAVISAPDQNGNPLSFNAAAVTQQCMNDLLAVRYPDGVWRSGESALLVSYTDVNSPQTAVFDYNTYVCQPFFTWILWNGLLDYNRFFGPDARIIPAIEACATYHFESTVYGPSYTGPGSGGSDPAFATGIWHPQTATGAVGIGEGCYYTEAHKGFWNPAAPYGEIILKNPASYHWLNGFLLQAIAKLYAATGDVKWKNRANQLLNGMQGGDFGGIAPRPWNEMYAMSWKAFPDLINAPANAVGGLPDADITLGGWKNEAGGTALAPSIGEATPNNATYIYSGTGANDICEVSLSDPAGAIVNGPIKYRYGKRLNNGVVVNLRVRLMQGATEIAHWDHADIPFAPADATQALTAPQFAAITTPANLRLQFVRDAP